MKAAEYHAANLEQIATRCSDISPAKQAKLLEVLLKHEGLFLGKRGNWQGNPVHIEVVEGAKPYWAKPYPIPLKNRKVFEDEVYRQCDIGALRQLTAEEIKKRHWASPCFGVTKKNGTIRLVMDFRKLNEVLKRREYHLTTIDEMFQNILGFLLASVVDLNMGYLLIAVT